MIMTQKMFYYKRGELPVNFVLPEGVLIKKCVPHMMISGMGPMNIGRKKWLYYYLWSFVYRGFSRVFLEYDVMKGNRIVCKAVLISKVPNYAFLPQKGIHVAYVETLKTERNQGLMTMLLKYILQANPHDDLYVIVAVDNIPSMKAIEKAGFVRYAKGYKNKDGVFVTNEML